MAWEAREARKGNVLDWLAGNASSMNNVESMRMAARQCLAGEVCTVSGSCQRSRGFATLSAAAAEA